MHIFELLRLYREFERYDNHKRDYAVCDNKLERFYNYLSKLKSVCDKLQGLIEESEIEIFNSDSGALEEHEVKHIEQVSKLFVRLEVKRQAAANNI